jgi:hypothetical protein
MVSVFVRQATEPLLELAWFAKILFNLDSVKPILQSS